MGRNLFSSWNESINVWIAVSAAFFLLINHSRLKWWNNLLHIHHSKRCNVRGCHYQEFNIHTWISVAVSAVHSESNELTKLKKYNLCSSNGRPIAKVSIGWIGQICRSFLDAMNLLMCSCCFVHSLILIFLQCSSLPFLVTLRAAFGRDRKPLLHWPMSAFSILLVNFHWNNWCILPVTPFQRCDFGACQSSGQYTDWRGGVTVGGHLISNYL